MIHGCSVILFLFDIVPEELAEEIKQEKKFNSI